MVFPKLSYVLFLTMIFDLSLAEAMRSSMCKVCSDMTESQCFSTMKEIVQLMQPRDRIHSMSSLFKPGMCSDLDDEECAYATEQEITNIGWNTIVKTLKGACEEGKVKLVSPTVMQFSFASFHDVASHLPAKTRKSNSKNLIQNWRQSCSICDAIEADLENTSDEMCAYQILSTFVKLSDAERLDIFQSVFSSNPCSKLADSEEGCLAVYDTKFNRAEEKDRSAFAFKACALNKIPNLNQMKGKEESPLEYVPKLVSKCSACLESDTAESCTEKMFNGLFSMEDKDRLATFKNGLLSEKTSLKLCQQKNLDEFSADCLTKYDNYFKLMHTTRLRKGSDEQIEEIDLSLLESCAAGKLPTLVTDPLKLTHDKAYTHKGGVEAAINDWKSAKAQSQQSIKSNSLLRSTSYDSSCLYCVGMSDKDCLSELDELVDAVSNPVLMAVYASIFPNDWQLCSMGYSGPVEQCIEALKVGYSKLTDKERLAALLEVCGEGMLNRNFTPKQIFFGQEVLAEVKVQSTPFDETIGPILMFGLSATLALFLGMMVSHIIRKKRVVRKGAGNRYRMGPIHEYTSLDG